MTQWTLSLAGRYNYARIIVSDRSGDDPDLNGAYTFTRFNPAVGINFNPTPHHRLRDFQRGQPSAHTHRARPAPTPRAPCKLPNVFLADPPLQQVVAKTFEAGARGNVGSATVQWAAAVYRTNLENDIQFIASGAGATNVGFFQNVGPTRRQGVELLGSMQWPGIRLTLRYSYIDATYRSGFLAASANNSTADANGAVAVEPGDRIPGIPADSAKLRADWSITDRWALGGTLVYASSQYAHGDENNQDSHGPVPGYTVINLDTQVQITPELQLFANIGNTFNRQYQNFGLLGAQRIYRP